MDPLSGAVVGGVARSLSDKTLEKISAQIADSPDLQKEKEIREKLVSSSYRIGPCRVQHITVDLLGGATALKLEIIGPGLIGDLAREYHLTEVEEIREIVENTDSSGFEAVQQVGDELIEEVYLVVHSSDPHEIHNMLFEFCESVGRRL
ncbi:hypothetical protein [Halosimplex sp. TS25]|uniref:hypothetical protein n=1 Tax=Halosimplex rarum TaxID=3396619 RepID=UPI0039EBA454